LPSSATYILPAASTATPSGVEKPVAMVIGVPVPPTISFTTLLFWSPINILPAPSTATPAGILKPEPSVVVAVLYPGAATPMLLGVKGVIAVPALYVFDPA